MVLTSAWAGGNTGLNHQTELTIIIVVLDYVLEIRTLVD